MARTSLLGVGNAGLSPTTFFSPSRISAMNKAAGMHDKAPTTTMTGIPSEVKRRIAELAYEQDQKYFCRVGPEGDKCLPDMSTPSSDDDEDNSDFELPRKPNWYGTSTNALFQVDREFHTIVAPVLFQVSIITV